MKKRVRYIQPISILCYFPTHFLSHTHSLARMGGGGGAALGGRRASGEGVDSSDTGKLAGFAVAAVVIAGALYFALNSAM